MSQARAKMERHLFQIEVRTELGNFLASITPAGQVWLWRRRPAPFIPYWERAEPGGHIETGVLTAISQIMDSETGVKAPRSLQ